MDMQEQALQVSAESSVSESENALDTEKANRASSSIFAVLKSPRKPFSNLRGGGEQTENQNKYVFHIFLTQLNAKIA